jgi:exonuclease III
VKLVTWNVRGAPPPLVEHLGAILRRLEANVVVLTGTAHDSLPPLRAALAAAGFPHAEATAPSDQERGVLVAARQPLRRIDLPDLPVPHRALLVALDSFQASVLGIHAPLAGALGDGSDAQAMFWTWLRAELERRHGEPLLVAGDLNTCVAEDGDGHDLPCAGELQRVLAAGWRSAFRAVHPVARARSWWHPAGSAFRIDDVLVPATAVVSAAGYHTEAGGHRLAWSHEGHQPAGVLSDHAALAVAVSAIG